MRYSSVVSLAFLTYIELNIRRFGSYETGFREDDTNDHYWNLPNIIGIRKK